MNKLINSTARILRYHASGYALIKLISYLFWLKSTKLCDNDSLGLLYILSSSIYTLIFLYTFIFFILYSKKSLLYIHSLIFFMVSAYFIYTHNSRNYAILFLQNYSINNTLQNGLLNIHPILIYFMYANIISIWFYFYLYDNTNLFELKSSSKVYNILFYSLIGVYLGGFWANQELNWGGFWSWDPVEIVSFVGVIFYTKLLHNKNNLIINNAFVVYLISMWLVYIIIRLGVVNTIHSFIRAKNVSFYINILISSIVIYTSYYTINLVKCFYFLGKFFTHKNSYKIQINTLFIYLYVYMIYLVCAVSLPFSILNIAEFYNGLLLVIAIYFILFSINFGKIQYLSTILLLYILLHIFYKSNNPIFIIFILSLFITIFMPGYPHLHLLLLFTYALYFIFMFNVPIYNNINGHVYYIYMCTGSAIAHDKYNFYELAFFLKKQFFLTKLKSFILHIKGFSIQTNGALSVYIFYKQIILKYLFSIEYIYISIYILFFIFLIFIRTTFIYVTKKYDTRTTNQILIYY